MTTLLLNANAVPLSFLPVSSKTWQEAIKIVYLGDAEVLHSYNDWEVHSPSVTMSVPSVIILKKQAKAVRTWVAREDHNPQRFLVFLRDMYICQYCNEQFHRNALTLDHVLPRKLGGRTTWNNVASSCSPCNGRRGVDVSIQPKNKPYKPTYNELLKNMRKFPISIPTKEWNWYLGWDEDKIRMVDQRSEKETNDNFDFGIHLSLKYLDT